MQIRSKYTLTLLTAAITPLLVAMGFVIWQSHQQITQLTISNLQSQMNAAAESLGGFFDSRISEIAAYTESPVMQSMDFSKIRPLIKSELTRHQGIYEKFILGTPEGHF